MTRDANRQSVGWRNGLVWCAVSAALLFSAVGTAEAAVVEFDDVVAEPGEPGYDAGLGGHVVTWDHYLPQGVLINPPDRSSSDWTAVIKDSASAKSLPNVLAMAHLTATGDRGMFIFFVDPLDADKAEELTTLSFWVIPLETPGSSDMWSIFLMGEDGVVIGSHEGNETQLLTLDHHDPDIAVVCVSAPFDVAIDSLRTGADAVPEPASGAMLLLVFSALLRCRMGRRLKEQGREPQP